MRHRAAGAARGRRPALADRLAASGSLITTPDAAASLEHIVDAWMAARDALMVTLGSNVRRDEIGDAIARRLVAAGELQPDGIAIRADAGSACTVLLRQGEAIHLRRQIVATDPAGRLARIASNGELAVLERARHGRGGDTVLLRLEGGRLVEVGTASLVATHATVLQAYKAQGATADSVLLDWHDCDLQRAYPALSRQRRYLCVVMSPPTAAFDDARRPTPAERLVRAAAADHAPRAELADGLGDAPLPELAALRAVVDPSSPPSSAVVWWPRQAGRSGVGTARGVRRASPRAPRSTVRSWRRVRGRLTTACR